MFESHRPFIQDCMHKIDRDEVDITPSDVEDYLKGELVDGRLALAFGAWSRKDPHMGKIFLNLKKEDGDWLSNYVNQKMFEKNINIYNRQSHRDVELEGLKQLDKNLVSSQADKRYRVELEARIQAEVNRRLEATPIPTGKKNNQP